MNAIWFIAKRYIVSKREATFITVISVISILGISVGVAALLVVLSVFNGFNSLVTGILLGFDPHIRIESAGHLSGQDPARLMKSVSDPRIAGASAFVSGKVMIISKKTSKVVLMRGLEPESLPAVSGLPEKIIQGSSQLTNQSKTMMIGYSLADMMGIDVGDSVFILGTASARDYLLTSRAPSLHKFIISGIYESNNKDYDAHYCFSDLISVQNIFQTEQIDGIDIRVKSMDDVEAVQSSLQESLGTGYSFSTWYDLHKDLYSVMKIERWSAFIILTLIIVVATFNLLGSLMMTVIEKTRDIGILKSFGASERDIQRIFRLEGIIVGLIGTIVGSSLGYLICWLQVEYRLFPLDESVYIIPALPVEMRISDFIIVSIVTFMLSYVATIFPSRQASRIIPAEAIRWE